MPAPPVAPFETLQRQLCEYRDEFPGEALVVDRFQALLDEHPRCFERDCWAGHITGSAWLVDESGSDVLLTHHRKLDAWLQLGGHSDGDPDTAAVAMREAEEESGLRVALIRPAIFDIDVHEIPARKNDPTHFHFDVRYALVSRSGREYRVSAESKDLAWVGIDDIHRYTTEASIARMAGKWAEGRWREGRN